MAYTLFCKEWILNMTQIDSMQNQLISTQIPFVPTKERIITIKKDLKRLASTPLNLDVFDQAATIALLHKVRTSIDGIAQTDTKIARELMLVLLDLTHSLPDALTERYSDACQLFADSVYALAQLYKKITVPNDHIIQIIIDRVNTDRWGIYSAIVDHFKDILQESGLEKLYQKSMHNAGYMPRTAKKILIQIADVRNDVDAFIRACALDGKITTQQALGMAERLINHNRLDDALKCITPFESAEQQDVHARCAAQELKAKVLELQGNTQQAHDLLLELFNISLDSRLYKKLSEHSLTDTNDFSSKAVQTALDHTNPHMALAFFIDMQLHEHITTIVTTKTDTLNGKYASILGAAAQQIQVTYPAIAITLYQIIIDYDLAQAHSDNDTCLIAARALTSLVFLFHSLEDQDVKKIIDEYYATLHQKYAQRKAFWKAHEQLFAKTMTAIQHETEETPLEQLSTE